MISDHFNEYLIINILQEGHQILFLISRISREVERSKVIDASGRISSPQINDHANV